MKVDVFKFLSYKLESNSIVIIIFSCIFIINFFSINFYLSMKNYFAHVLCILDLNTVYIKTYTGKRFA